MSILDYLRSLQKRRSASIAKERLQIIVAHERNGLSRRTLDFLPLLQKELLDVVRKYVEVSDSQIKVNLEKNGNYEVLEVNIALADAEGRFSMS
ncbi:cell division topological specificity factor MinE [Syntrophus aciditrophicus]|uniref:Cell division topological specificity factor n=1 Tax=Syntrophus aciditrophicus (strain SB) TaxID=56780 RepID=MINE_SYNAS|nr:cell division topological specificity factor MinE [Syntrophus aciditrophicus]Q2LRX3.2 RecName: Full=Cell division topological specificity factor [Syntrophus aciditrophicus SB]OPY17780.1 MAG: Cell division topological specificity factor [Syntrophus sp. PtaB.Bin075]